MRDGFTRPIATRVFAPPVNINPNLPDFEGLQRRLSDHTATIGVLGLGYVGLPLSLNAVDAGYRVVGFDIDKAKPAKLMAGESYLSHIAGAQIAQAVRSDRFEATSDFDQLLNVDVIIVCVPTPLTRHHQPDLTYVKTTSEAIAKRLRPGQLVIVESTTYPGTTTEIVKPILETSSLRADREFFLAYSPEREDPGNARFSATNTPKVVGADNIASARLAAAFYEASGQQAVQVSDSATAEAVKLTENIFRAVNIALVNELKMVYAAMDIDVWEVIDAAKTKPFGYMAFYPGPGLGGHCIPIDPFYLAWKAREFRVPTRFIELAGEINTHMPEWVMDRLVRALDQQFGKGLRGSRILLVGIAYKPEVNDMRESPALRIIEMLEAREAIVDYHDPFVPVIPETREHPLLTGRQSRAWTIDLGADYDAALIITDHKCIDYEALVAAAPLTVDCRNACGKAGIVSKKVAKA